VINLIESLRALRDALGVTGRGREFMREHPEIFGKPLCGCGATCEDRGEGCCRYASQPHEPAQQPNGTAENYFKAAERHAQGLSAQLEKPGWRPSRAHVEQARNTIQKLVKEARIELDAALTSGSRTPAATQAVTVEQLDKIQFGRVLHERPAAAEPAQDAPAHEDLEVLARALEVQLHSHSPLMLTSVTAREVIAGLRSAAASRSPSATVTEGLPSSDAADAGADTELARLQHDIGRHLDQITRLEALVERLRGAIKPFADEGSVLKDTVKGSTLITHIAFTAGEFRAASAAHSSTVRQADGGAE
jgi:hypothetical protein